MKGLLEPLFHARRKAVACNTCGSELARDEAMTSNIFFDCQAAIASKLAPTGGLGVFEECIFMTVLFQTIL
ncbi:hypothetical protein VP02_11245 [Pseudomonas ogarae]|uniref:Uncharacterized protein n=1 Tax=Pseudomonas kilonensis TaxID=132476 RepID=A0A0F4XRK0_9PSED|nr:hypothetical protein VP02_11245 [Pseudomonas ogarae]